MDKNFLEMWGNYLINLAKGQRQMEDISRWMGKEPTGFSEFSSALRKFYGLDSPKADAAKQKADVSEAWRSSIDTFWKSYREYLDTIGMIPKEEHLKLVRKYEDLKKKVAACEETIEHLRMLLNEKGGSQGEVVEKFQYLVQDQSERFQELMRDMGQFYQQTALIPENDEKK